MGENKKVENKKVESIKRVEIVKRKDYINLVNFLNEFKNIENKEKIKGEYEKVFNLKFSNFERVFKRSLRNELKDNLNLNLEKNNLSLNEYLEIGVKIKNMSKERSSNFLIVEKIIN